MPSLRQLEYLVALSEERHFRRAAEKLGISQPTLSAQLRVLEERLGSEMVERGRNGVLITPLGQQVVEIARRIKRDVSEIRALAAAGRGPLGGALRLGVPPTVGPHLLPRMMPELHRSYPSLTLYVREETPSNLPAGLSRGTHDLLITPLPVRGPDLVTKPIFREPLYVVLAEDHPLASKKALAREDLAGADVLTLERGHQLQEQVEALCTEFGARLRLDYGGTSLDTLSQMVAMGTGISFLPGLYVERALPRLPGIVVRTLEGRSLSRTIGAVWRASSSRQDDYSTVISFVRETVAREFPGFPLL